MHRSRLLRIRFYLEALAEIYVIFPKTAIERTFVLTFKNENLHAGLPNVMEGDTTLQVFSSVIINISYYIFHFCSRKT